MMIVAMSAGPAHREGENVDALKDHWCHKLGKGIIEERVTWETEKVYI